MVRADMTRRSFVAASFGMMAAAVLGVSGCGTNGSAPASTQQSSSAAETEPPAPTVLSAALRAEETMLTAPEAFFSVSPVMAMLKHHVFEGLYDLDLHTGSVRRGLAAAAPTRVNATTYDVTLREDAVFSDGSPVQAAHVEAAYEELIAQSATYASLLAPIATVMATSARTVRITLTVDEPAFLQERLSLIKVCAPGADANATPTTERIGSGPWMYAAINPAYDSAASENALASVDAVEGAASADASVEASEAGSAASTSEPSEGIIAIPSSVVFAPNPHYTGDAFARAEGMSWYFASDDAFRTDFFEEGGALAVADVPPSDAGALNGHGNEMEFVPGSLSPFLMFNCAAAPFDNPSVRQAILYAIDYDRLIADVFDGRASHVTCALPATHANYHRAKTVYSHDVTRAQHVLERIGITPSTPAEYSLVVCEEWLKPVGERLAEDLAQVGVNVTLNVMDMASFMAQSSVFDMVLAVDDPALVGSDCDLFLTWRYGGGVAPESAAGWQTTEAYAAVMENLHLARTFTDRAQQQKCWNDCFDLIAESAPLYPLCFLEVATAWNNDALDGFSPLGTGCIDFTGVSLS